MRTHASRRKDGGHREPVLSSRPAAPGAVEALGGPGDRDDPRPVGKRKAVPHGRDRGAVERGEYVERLACPGYTRGLDFHQGVAAVGVSKPRAEAIAGLPLEKRLAEKNAEPQSAVLLFDTASNSVIHSVVFRSVVEEVFDVAFLPGASNPRLIHPASNEAAAAYHIGTLKKSAPVKK